MKNKIRNQKLHPSRRQNTYFPDDIIEDILVILPVKSLLRFKGVSKSWYSLINNPGFARANFQRRQHHHSNSLIIKRNYFSIPKIVEYLDLFPKGSVNQDDQRVKPKKLSWPFGPVERWSSTDCLITCCSEGILCMVMGDNDLVLWNPRINRYKRLPAPKPDFEGGEWDVIGFAYDSTISDFKVVILASQSFWPPEPRNNREVQVLNAKSNVWRKVYKDFPYGSIRKAYRDFPYSRVDEKHAAPLNGGLYFLRRKQITNGNIITALLRFDLAEETLREVSIPPSLAEGRNNHLSKLSLLRGVLYLSHTLGTSAPLDLWVMKDEACWIKIVSIPRSGFIRPLYVTEDGALLLMDGITFIIYDPKRNSLREFNASWNNQVIVNYDSLISPSDDD